MPNEDCMLCDRLFLQGKSLIELSKWVKSNGVATGMLVNVPLSPLPAATGGREMCSIPTDDLKGLLNLLERAIDVKVSVYETREEMLMAAYELRGKLLAELKEKIQSFLA